MPSKAGYIDASHLNIARTARGVMLSFPAGVEKTVRIIDIQGRERGAYVLKNGAGVLVNRSIGGGSGIVYAVWDEGGHRMLARLNTVY